MTDQPRDLAAEAAEISRIHDEGRYDQYGEHPAESIGTLLDYIAALSRELEELRRPLAELKKEAESEEGMEPQRMMQYLCRRVDALQKTTRRLQPDNERLRAENERLTKDLAHWKDCHGVTVDSLAAAESELAALRRPVDFDDLEIRAIRHDDSVWAEEHLAAAPGAHRKALMGRRYLLSALDQAQRENEGLQTAVVQLEEVCRIKDQQIARLSSPPPERAEIVERRKAGYSSASVHLLEMYNLALADIDTLLGDCAAWRNALGISWDALSERNRECVELRERCGRLEVALHSYVISDDYRDPPERHREQDPFDPLYIRFRNASTALAASQQHTAGGTEPAVLRLSGHQVNILREFTDGDESFPVLIQRLPERTACNGDRMQEGLYVWSEDYPDEGVLLLPEDPGQQHTAGSGDGVAGE